MIMLLSDRMTQGVMSVAIGIHALMQLMMEELLLLLLLLLLQCVLVQRTSLHFFQLLISFSSRGRGFLQQQRLSGWGRRWWWRRWGNQLARSGSLRASQGALFLIKTIDFVATPGPHFMIFIAIVQTEVVGRSRV